MGVLSSNDMEKLIASAKLRVSTEHQEKLSHQLNTILSYVDLLQKAPTEGIEPTIQVIQETSVTRPDIPRTTPLADPEALLACSHQKQDMKQIRVPKVLE